MFFSLTWTSAQLAIVSTAAILAYIRERKVRHATIFCLHEIGIHMTYLLRVVVSLALSLSNVIIVLCCLQMSGLVCMLTSTNCNHSTGERREGSQSLPPLYLFTVYLHVQGDLKIRRPPKSE